MTQVTQTTPTSNLLRSAIGFDQLTAMLERASRENKGSTAYPPYNLVSLSETRYQLTLAVAGFEIEDLQIEQRTNTLVVKGKQSEITPDGAKVLHRGIANRAFEREFHLADHIKVIGADLKLGLLTIDLEKEVPEEMRPREIKIVKN